MSEEGDEKRTKGDTSEEDEDYRPTFMTVCTQEKEKNWRNCQKR
jgi:hypothetical protein